MSTPEVCTTQEAASILGISVSSVQQLVETGALEAWKTKGGHRRIPLEAIESYKMSPAKPPVSPVAQKVHIMVVEDNPMQCEIYGRLITSLDLPIRLTFIENGYQALIEVVRNTPDILLVDIMMNGIDGYELIQTLLSYPDLGDINIAILTSLSLADLEARGGVPDGVAYFGKPVNYDELRGFLRACCIGRLRPRRA